ncbi:MAG TPA: hypothetical protein VJH37_01180 [Candidatus Nanoarchaeia archaeon]|nr:hypothetical protein [Candidatus Nanoarchaeia archaeon]
MRHSGQAGVEYIILTGVLMFFFIPIVYFSLTQSTDSVKQTQVENIVNRLGKAADAVYALGPGSIEVIPITIPEGVQSTLVGGPEGREILLVVSGSGDVSDAHVSTRAKVMGFLPTTKGTYFIKVEALPGGYVNITQR